MKKGQIFEGIVERVDFPNKGLVRVHETVRISDTQTEKNIHTVIVKDAVRGQKVRLQITKKRSGKCEGRLLEVTERAPMEVEADCPHFGACGGCTYRTLPYQEQLKMKEEQVRTLLDAVCPDSHFEGIKGSPVAEAYRNKMEFTFGDTCKNGPLSLGMHKKGSFYDIVTVDQCRIVDPDFRMILRAVLEFAKQSGMPYFHRQSHIGYLRHLLVRKAVKTGEILVDLVTSTQMEDLTGKTVSETELDQSFTKKLLGLSLQGTMKGILHTHNDSPADAVVNQGTRVLWGEGFFYEELLGLKFKITPFSFFQTNSRGAELLYDTARTYLGDINQKVIFDLYSGTGTIAQILAPVAKKVTGVEIIEEAVEAARENAEANGLDNCSFIAGDVLKVIDELQDGEWPELIVLDPPRDGIHPKALARIAKNFAPSQMIYISCKPTSLARDLILFQEYGYRVERSCCVDMFPGTVHVETVCLLSKLSGAKNTIDVKVDMDELDVTSADK